MDNTVLLQRARDAEKMGFTHRESGLNTPESERLKEKLVYSKQKIVLVEMDSASHIFQK